MVQTVKSIKLLSGEKKILFERPHVLHRIFFSIRVLVAPNTWYATAFSFDDPLFVSSYSLNGVTKTFEASGPDIFQGNVWLKNASPADLWYAATEILH